MKASLFACLATAFAGTVSVDIEKHLNTAHLSRGDSIFARLAAENSNGISPIVESLADGFYSYYAALYIGSNRQKVIPILDTGSSDLWVMSSSNPYCQGNSDCTGMTFDPSTSTTFQNTTTPWNIQYLDTTGAFGFLAKDTVEVGGTSVTDANFALAGIANSTHDVFGVGLTNDEASVQWHRNGTYTGFKYPNFPVMLKDQGHINKIAYSLYLNDVNAADGNILFGGVDHAKYSGTLGIVPIVNVFSRFINATLQFDVMLHGISITSGGTSCPLFSGMSFPVVLDSGTSFAVLPTSTVTQIASAYGYTYNSDDGFYEGSCNVFDFDGFELDFSGIKLNVPAQSLVAPSGRADTPCVLALQPTDDISNFILGDVFMRNFYIVYDLENLQIALAQAVFTDDSNVEEIISTIPSATSAPNYSATNFQIEPSNLNAAACQTKTTTATMPTFISNPDGLQSTLIGLTSNSTSATATASSTTALNSTGSAAPGSAASSTAAATSVSFISRNITGSTPTSSSTSTASVITSGSISPISTSTASNETVSSLSSTSGPISNISTSYSFNGTSSTVLSSSSAAPASATTYSNSISGSTTHTLTVPTPTTLTTAGQTFTVSDSTVLTITDCGCTKSKSHEIVNDLTSTSLISSASATTAAWTTTTEVVSTLITSCSEPTTFSTNGATYTVTDKTVLTITDCPCTLTHTIPKSSSTSSVASSSTPITSEAATSSISTSLVASSSSPIISESAVSSTLTSTSLVASSSTPIISEATTSSASTSTEKAASSVPSSSVPGVSSASSTENVSATTSSIISSGSATLSTASTSTSTGFVTSHSSVLTGSTESLESSSYTSTSATASSASATSIVSTSASTTGITPSVAPVESTPSSAVLANSAAKNSFVAALIAGSVALNLLI